MTLSCPLLNEDNKSTFDVRYALNISKVYNIIKNPDYLLFTIEQKCMYGYGHADLVQTFINYSFNFEEVFNVVNDNDNGIMLFIKHNQHLRFIITDVKNTSIKLYYLKSDEPSFAPGLKLATNPIYSYMKLKGELTDYFLNFSNLRLGNNIESILDKLLVSLNTDMKNSYGYRRWNRPRLYKKGGLAIKKLWSDYSPESMIHPYLDEQTLKKLTSQNSDYDVTILFQDRFTSQAEYMSVVNDIYKFISDNIRDKYKETFVDIINVIKGYIRGKIPLSEIKDIYNNLPQASIPIYNTNKDEIYIELDDQRIPINGISCINSDVTMKASYDNTWIDKWDKKWEKIQGPIEFKLNLIKRKYPSLVDTEVVSCNPTHLKDLDACFTLFRCLGRCNVVGNNHTEKANFEILDISIDCDFEKINTESSLQFSREEKDDNIHLNFASLLYDIYSIIVDSEDEMTKSDKRCNRFNYMLTIYDKLIKDGHHVNVDFFQSSDKVKFIKNFLRFCTGYNTDKSPVNENFIRNMSFFDFTNFSKKLQSTPVNQSLRKSISNSIKKLPDINLIVNQTKRCFRAEYPIFLQGGIKLLLMLDELKQYDNVYQKIKDKVSPTDFDYFTFYSTYPGFPSDIINELINCKEYYTTDVNLSSEWKNVDYEQSEIIHQNLSILYDNFMLDKSTPYKIYNKIDTGYYNPNQVKTSRPYVVCSKTTYVSCVNNPEKFSEINLLELNIVNTAMLDSIIKANTVDGVEVETVLLHLQASYGFVYDIAIKPGITAIEIENISFLITSYMNYVYNLKPVNSLLRFLVASIFLIDRMGYTLQQLDYIFTELASFFVKRKITSTVKYFHNGNMVNDNLDYSNNTVLIPMSRTKVNILPVNPYAHVFKDRETILDYILQINNLVSFEKLAEDANIQNIRC